MNRIRPTGLACVCLFRTTTAAFAGDDDRPRGTAEGLSGRSQAAPRWFSRLFPRRPRPAQQDTQVAKADDASTRDPSVIQAQATAAPAVPSSSLPGPAPMAASPLPGGGTADATAPAPVPAPATTTAQPGAISAAGSAFAAAASAPALTNVAAYGSRGIPQMIGDQAPIAIRSAVTLPPPPGLPTPFPPGTPPPTPSPRLATALVPSVRGFKIAENQSPQPQDRVFFTFNYFNDLNAALNKQFESPLKNFLAYRYIGGFEKTFLGGQGSVGFRLPMNVLDATPTIPAKFKQPGGTTSALGDLSLFAKYVLAADPKTGSLVSVGLETTLPTGPQQFAGAKYIEGLHSTEIQPFLGYLLIRDRFYLHGFLSMSTPSSVRDVTMVYNDFGLGYYVYRDRDNRKFLTSVAPTFEVHVNDPLNHRDVFNANDKSGTADVVDLTAGLNLTFYGQSVITLGFVTLVTGPRPFSYEALVLFNFRFGRSRSGAALPILGG